MKFAKGQSGNPKGRPKRNLNRPQVRQLLTPLSPTFKAKLAELLNHEDGRVQVEALKLGMAYLWGKPQESLEIGSAGGGPVDFSFTLITLKGPEKYGSRFGDRDYSEAELVGVEGQATRTLQAKNGTEE